MVSLSDFTENLIIYIFFAILIIGSVGNVLNLITLITKNFRTQASIFYLLWSTIWGLILITVGIIFRFATEYFGNNLINTNRIICKVRNYLLVCLPFMSTMCVFLAAFDRCVATSLNARWRQLSSMVVARRMAPVSVTIVALSGLFLYFVYDIHNSKCLVLGDIELLMVNIYVCLFSTSFPIMGMLICGILTLIHYKKSRHRIETVSNSIITSQHQRRLINEQVIILTLVQSTMSIIIYSIRCFTYIYAITTASISKSIQQQHIEYLIQQVSIMLLYMNHSIVFYLNCNFSTTFRKTFKSSMRNIIEKCF